MDNNRKHAGWPLEPPESNLSLKGSEVTAKKVFPPVEWWEEDKWWIWWLRVICRWLWRSPILRARWAKRPYYGPLWDVKEGFFWQRWIFSRRFVRRVWEIGSYQVQAAKHFERVSAAYHRTSIVGEDAPLNGFDEHGRKL